MASALKSAFGSSGNDNPLQTFGEPRVYHQGTTHAHGHGLLKNLLEDAVTTAKGIPFGLVQTVEHPIKTAEAFGKSYQDYYGHGFGHFWHEFHAHPLQPLIDAISVPLVLAGGAGFAIKGADLAANVGRDASLLAKADELVKTGDFAGADKAIQEASRYPKLAKAAQHFQPGKGPTTRFVSNEAGISLPRAYSTNLWRRALTRGSESIFEGVGNLAEKVSVNQTGGITKAVGNFYSTAGKGRRLFGQELSRREAAAAGRAFGQVKLLQGAKLKGIAAEEAGHALEADFQHLLHKTALKVRQEDALKLKGTHPIQGQVTYIKGFKTFDEPGTNLAMQSMARGGEQVQATAGTARVLRSYEPGHISEFVKTLGAHAQFTSDPAKALVDEHGMVSMVRKGTVDTWRKEVDGSARLFNAIYKSSLTLWKGMILAESPRYLVNNVIGNAGMYAAATNPVEFTRGVLAATKSVHGVRAAAKAAEQMDGTLSGMMAKFLPDEFVHQQFGFLQHGALGLGPVIENRLSHALKRGVTSGLYPITEKIAYRGPQRASIMGAMTTLPGFRALMRSAKAGGESDYAAFQTASKKLLADPRNRAVVEKRVTDWAGQYYHLNSLERNLTAFVPFYNWTRHALRFGKEQTLSRPVQTATLAQLGALGDKQASKELGHVPDFLKGAIPVHGHAGGVLGLLFGQAVQGRKKVILTAGYNPLAAAAEDARAIASLVGGGHARESIGGQLNPVISGAIAGVTGERLFSGARANYAGPLQGIIGETFGQLPQVRLTREELANLGVGKKQTAKTKKGEPTLYTKDVRQQLSSILGLNERDFSPKAAERLYREQQGIKAGRRRVRYKARKAALSLGGQSSAMKSQL